LKKEKSKKIDLLKVESLLIELYKHQKIQTSL